MNCGHSSDTGWCLDCVRELAYTRAAERDARIAKLEAVLAAFVTGMNVGGGHGGEWLKEIEADARAALDGKEGE